MKRLSRVFYVVVLTLWLIARSPAFVPPWGDQKPTSLSDARAAVEANLRTPEGKGYDTRLGNEFMAKYLPVMKQCKQTAGDDLGSFWILIKMEKDGAVEEVLLYPTTKLGTCTRERLLKGTFSPPPRPAYWVSIYMKLAH